MPPRVYKYRHTLLAAFIAGRVDHDEYLRQVARLRGQERKRKG